MAAIRLTCDHELLRSRTGSWVIEHLTAVLAGRGVRATDGPGVVDDALHVVAGLTGGEAAALVAEPPQAPESFVIAHVDTPAGPALVVVAADERGLTYGLLELADVAEHAEGPLGGHAGDAVLAALRAVPAGAHQPATEVRSVLRTLTSYVQDLSWFHDRDFWREYLTHLATHRINRLQLALGMQYNYSHDPDVRDSYLAFAYPFLVAVPGFDVAVVDQSEREANLASLRFISEEAGRRGIHFQLGLWNHAYEFPDSPRQHYRVSGLSADNHAEYCQAALRELLLRCPGIDGVTIRVHYEGGVHEPTHEFWGTVLAGVREVGRPVEIDMHAKGVDARILDAARATGAPLVVSAKYWAEHWGLPYHQSSVREMECARPPREGLSGVTRNERRFTRYGYGDFLRADRDYGFMFRIWPGTQRVLLWGDPEQVAGIARATAQVGGRGVELCEPLSFLGRKTTGTYGSRELYADRDLQLDGDPWTKYAYTYRLWGRLLYDPEAHPSTWLRYLSSRFGRAADDLAAAIGAASRVLPLVTTSHGPSASNNFYWPEMYVNMPLAQHGRSEHYAFDTPEPGTVGAVSSFDPELFASIDTYADEVLSGRPSGRYTPVDVAEWLEDLVRRADRHLAAAVAACGDAGAPEFRRTTTDVAVLAALGTFFAQKTRAGLDYALYERTHASGHLLDAVEHYRAARDAFVSVVGLTDGVYVPDLAFGDRASERGHWSDRLPAVEQDLAELEAELAAAPVRSETARAIVAGPARGYRPVVRCTVPETFDPGVAVPVEVAVLDDADCTIDLHYRRLNQGEQWSTMAMTPLGHRHGAAVPGADTDSAYAVQLYFTVHGPTGDAWTVPGLGESLTDQPYFVLRHAAHRAGRGTRSTA
ncbi:hypothetical protein ACFS27_15335 [Promicromonospora vindobonensis]|uniref:Glycosyl hydrolase family 115 (Putative glucuronidase) n=1 Tax=Promicromonospora vindobonensis TaxID=195748 RepID=A0ABW5VV75_9MICO